MNSLYLVLSCTHCHCHCTQCVCRVCVCVTCFMCVQVLVPERTRSEGLLEVLALRPEFSLFRAALIVRPPPPVHLIGRLINSLDIKPAWGQFSHQHPLVAGVIATSVCGLR